MNDLPDPTMESAVDSWTPRWQILIVEDSADDAELIRLELLQAGIDADCHCVDSELQLMQALASFVPHLVLSDMNMPGFSGPRAFELVHAHAPEAHFVFLSGAPLDDETALQLGPAADAWLLKDDLAQLPALVRRLLEG
jgi:CheY-like chemotaxis protein